jgi:hypothetical protein
VLLSLGPHSAKAETYFEAASETKAEASEEPPEDPLLLFSVLYAFWVANFVAFNGDVAYELAKQFLDLAEKQRATIPLMIGHRVMGISLTWIGDITEGRQHLDRAQSEPGRTGL